MNGNVSSDQIESVGCLLIFDHGRARTISLVSYEGADMIGCPSARHLASCSLTRSPEPPSILDQRCMPVVAYRLS